MVIMTRTESKKKAWKKAHKQLNKNIIPYLNIF